MQKLDSTNIGETFKPVNQARRQIKNHVHVIIRLKPTEVKQKMWKKIGVNQLKSEAT